MKSQTEAEMKAITTFYLRKKFYYVFIPVKFDDQRCGVIRYEWYTPVLWVTPVETLFSFFR